MRLFLTMPQLSGDQWLSRSPSFASLNPSPKAAPLGAAFFMPDNVML
jgi:hypothetical protein